MRNYVVINWLYNKKKKKYTFYIQLNNWCRTIKYSINEKVLEEKLPKKYTGANYPFALAIEFGYDVNKFVEYIEHCCDATTTVTDIVQRLDEFSGQKTDEFDKIFID